MKYYKIIKNDIFIGVINSYNFIRYVPRINGFINANETTGELVEYNNRLYRSAWMRPLTNNITNEYELVTIIEIDEETYNSFKEAIEENQEISEEEYLEPELPTTPIDPIEEVSVEFIRSSKLNEISTICRKTIENGFDLELRNEVHHFSLDTQDQLNLISLSAMAQTQELIPYHADGEACIFYTAAEMNQIIEAATKFKIYHTTYHNALKAYINSLNTVEEISAIQYGIAIPEEYQSDVLKALQV